MTSAETHVWHADLDADTGLSGRLKGFLSQDEQARGARFHFQKDRERFIIARGILRVLLGRYLQTDPTLLQLQTDEKGKPHLASPETKSGLCFNLSHSGSKAVFAICWNRPIGIDVEQMRSVPDAMNIVEAYFSASEKTRFRNLPPQERDRAFLVLWTQKEAYLKAIGEGLGHPLDREPEPDWVVGPIDLGPEYVAAIASRGWSGDFLIFQWDLLHC